MNMLIVVLSETLETGSYQDANCTMFFSQFRSLSFAEVPQNVSLLPQTQLMGLSWIISVACLTTSLCLINYYNKSNKSIFNTLHSERNSIIVAYFVPFGQYFNQYVHLDIIFALQNNNKCNNQCEMFILSIFLFIYDLLQNKNIMLDSQGTLITANLNKGNEDQEFKVKQIDNLLQRLRKTQQGALLMQTNFLKIRRKKTEISQKKTYYRNIQLGQLKPGDAISRIFTSLIPLNTGNVFLDVKQKMKLLFTNRAFTKMPNIVTGVPRRRIYTQSKKEQMEHVNRKFSEYDRVVTEQTGELRIQLRNKLEMNQGYISKKPIYTGKLKSIEEVFSGFEKSNNDFSVGIRKTCSTNAFSFGSKTRGSRESSNQNIKHNMSKKSKMRESKDQENGASSGILKIKNRFYTDFS